MTGKRDSARTRAWQAIFEKLRLFQHDFSEAPFYIRAEQIKRACQHFKKTTEKEVRILCTQTTREMRPAIFQDLGLFLLPVKNGEYAIVKGEGYVDIPPISEPPCLYKSQLGFELETSAVGDSEMQHLDFAYAASMLRDFMQDPSLVLTIRGRKYTPLFKFKAGGFNLQAESVQTEVDSGYEGQNKVALVEAKNGDTSNTIIRQLYYPYRQWQAQTSKPVSVLFFERQKTIDKAGEFHFWEFAFKDPNDYDSIFLQRSARYQMAAAGGGH